MFRNKQLQNQVTRGPQSPAVTRSAQKACQSTARACTKVKLFVKIASTGKTIPIELPEHSKIAQLRKEIFERAEIAKSASARLTYKGRLVSNDCANSLRACGLVNHTTLTLTCQSLLGGSETDDDFQRSDNVERVKSSSRVHEIETKNDGNDQETECNEGVVLAHRIFGESESDGLEASWADPVAYVDEVYGDIVSLDEQERNSEAIERARSELAQVYEIPQMKAGIKEIPEESLRNFEAALKRVEKDQGIVSLNQGIFELFNSEYDTDKKGEINSKAMQQFLLRLATELQISIDPTVIASMVVAMDTDGDGMFTRDEIFRKYTPEEKKQWMQQMRVQVENEWRAKKEKKQAREKAGEQLSDVSDDDVTSQLEDYEPWQEYREKSENSEDSQSDGGQSECSEDDFYGEHCFNRILREYEEQNKAKTDFLANLREGSDTSVALILMIDKFKGQQKWFQELPEQQDYLLQAILFKAWEGANLSDSKWDKKRWQDQLYALDQKSMLHVILCVGPSIIRNSCITDEDNKDLETLLDLVEGATSLNMLNMLLDAVEQHVKVQDGTDVLDEITNYFSRANLPQKRLMLQFTKQVSLKVRMIQKLSAKEVLGLIRHQSDDEVGPVHFPWLSLCSHAQLTEITASLTPTEKLQQSAWEHSTEIGLGMLDECPFYKLARKENELTRKVRLATDTSYLCCIPNPNSKFKGEFLRVEKQSNVKSATFHLFTDAHPRVGVDEDENDNDMKISMLRQNKRSKNLETYNSFQAAVPMQLKTKQRNGFARPILFSGQNGEIFSFHHNTRSNEFEIYLPYNQKQYMRVDTTSLLHKYLAEGNFTVDAEYGDVYMMPQAEPTLLNIGGKPNIVFSYARNGSPPSVVFYSINDDRDILQISGANMFMHQQESDSADIENLIFLTIPALCRHGQMPYEKIFKKWQNVDRQKVQLQAKRYQIKVSEFYESIEVREVDFMEDYESTQDKYYNPIQSESRAALIKDDSNWIAASEAFSQAQEHLIMPGCYQIKKHTGPSKRKFVSLQETSSIGQSYNTVIYEVNGSNEISPILEKRFQEGVVFLITQEAGTSPKILRVDFDQSTVEVLEYQNDVDDNQLDQGTDAGSQVQENDSQKSGADFVNDSDAGSEKSKSEDKSNWNRILFAKLPKELEIEEDQPNKMKVFYQPQMINGTIHTSCLSAEGDFKEVIIRKLAQNQQDENEDSEGSDDDKFNAVVQTKSMNNCESWKYTVNYPILASTNTERAAELTIANLATGCDDQLLIKLGNCQFVCFVNHEEKRPETATSIALIVFNNEEQKLQLQIFSLKECYRKDSIFNENGWSAQVIYLGQKFDCLNDLRDEIICAKFIQLEDQTGILVQTKKEIRFITEKSDQVVFESRADRRLSDIDLLISQNGQCYFISEETSTQTNFLWEVCIEKDETKRILKASRHEVYSFNAGLVMSVQLNRDNEQEQVINYQYDEILYSEKEHNILQTKTALVVLDTNYNQFDLTQLGSKNTFQESNFKSLSKEEALKNRLSKRQSNESLILTDRSITFRDEVSIIESGEMFYALQDVIDRKTQQVYQSKMIPESDLIMYKVTSKDSNASTLDLIFKRDAGRRNCNPVGTDQIRDCISASFISKDLFLLNLRLNKDTSRDIYKSSYWTLVTVDGEIKKISEKLQSQLDKDREVCIVQSRIIRGDVCQLFLSKQIREGYSDEQNGIVTVKNEPDGAVVIELTSQGDVLNKRKLIASDTRPNTSEEYAKVDFFQNYKGQILQLLVKGFTDEKMMDEESLPQISLGKRIENGKHEKPLQVMFDLGEQETTYLFAGKYFCWRVAQSMLIKFIDTTQTEVTVKEIDISDYVGKTEDYLIQIQESEAYRTIRMAQVQNLNESSIEFQANRIQLTIESSALLFDLNEDEPVPVFEVGAMGQLMDLQNYVDCGVTLSQIICKHSASRIHPTTLVPSGNDAYGELTWVQSIQSDEVRIKRRSSNLPQAKTHRTDIIQRPVIGFYKNHCEVDYKTAEFLIDCSESGLKPKRIDYKALWASYGNDIIFSLLSNNVRVVAAIQDYIQSLELKDLEDVDGTETYHPELRRLADILIRKSFLVHSDDKTKINLKTYLSSGLDIGLRDAILKIGRLSDNFSYMKTFNCQSDFEKFIEKTTPQITEELENCFNQTRSTRSIQFLDWPRSMDLLTIRSNKCIITKDEIEDELQEEEDKVTRAVQVDTLDMTWFYFDRQTFITFSKIVQKQPNKVYASIFVESLLDQFWDTTQSDLIKYQFVPYLLFVLSTLFFFVGALSESLRAQDGEEPTEMWQIWVQAGIAGAFLLNQIRLELQVIVATNKKDYFTDPWNINELISLSLTMFILLTGIQREPAIQLETLRPLAAIASCTLMIKVFDWLRLFEGTAFYILLVQETLKDVQSFMILLIAALMMFGMPMVLLNLNRTEDDAIVNETFSFWGLNLLLNQYLLALGEFNMDNFAGKPQSALCYLFFILATFVTQLTMLNMLIAIMGDTFERIMENKDVNATMTKLELMGDLVATLRQKSWNQDKNVFMFIVRPDADDANEENDWEGSVNKMTRVTGQKIKALEIEITKKTDRLQESLDDFVKKDQVSDKHLKAHIDKVSKASQKSSNHVIKTLEERINEKFNKILKEVSSIKSQVEQKKEKMEKGE